MNEKYNDKHFNLNDNFLFIQIKTIKIRHDDARKDENNISNLLFIILENFHERYRKFQLYIINKSERFINESRN